VSLSRRIGEYRSTAILAVRVVLSLVSLASGARGGPIASGLHTVVGVASLPFLLAFNTVEDSVLNVAGMFTEYDAVREENADLRRSVALLLQNAANRQELAAQNSRLREMMAFERGERRLVQQPVEVISRVDGTLTIDRGAVHGMRASMCVLSPRGVIGIITQTDPFTSHVATLQSPECNIDAMIKRNRVRGTVSGTGNDLNRICSMRYIDLKDDVRPGDIVVTSPDSVFRASARIASCTAASIR